MEEIVQKINLGVIANTFNSFCIKDGIKISE